ncbi:MAG: ketoacyl-ACP synthase III [Sphingobacteriaceae bacterium]|nr:ketoacyl-ACP synthase III [Sphingobacteriaceae bacterium]
MENKLEKYSTIIGTGSYIPENIINGDSFLNNQFFDNGVELDKSNKEIIEKFSEITEIKERRYADKQILNHQIGFYAAEKAIVDAKIDREKIDCIIFAHNFGDTRFESNRIDMIPSLASKVKELLQINNPNCVAYDLIFGCPGWVQGVIQANYLIKSGDAENVLVIGSETLSRNIDFHDRDCMIFSDGAGAVIFGAKESKEPTGIIAHKSQTHAVKYANLLTMGASNDLSENNGNLYLKMNGRKLYEFAVTQVPQVIKTAIDKANLHITDIKTVFIHQANGKMDKAIMSRLFKLYDIHEVPDFLVPMTIEWLGNSSVATVPTLIDLVINGKVENYTVKKGEYAIFASVGAGMNINAVIYRF